MTEKDYDKLKQIEEAIQSFNSKKLYESSLTLFKALDYQSNKTERISPNNFEGFIDSFNLPKNAINKDKAFVSHWKHIEFIFQVADSEITRVQSLFDTGEVDRNEYQSFLFFTIQLKEESYKRSELVKITRELNVPFKMPVIVLFHYGNKLTLSIIDRRLHKKDTSKDVLEKVTLIKDIDITNPQRAHKEILKDLSLNELYKKFEFHSFVKLHEAWKATLNISELNKKFYKELAYWYFWALQEVEFPDDELKDDKTRNPVNVIRLITRLIFVWFLKEKNLIPDDLFNKRELDKILDYKDKTGSTYYKAILQNLFFATLNTEMNKDVKDKNKISRTFVNRNTGVPHYFRYSRFIKDQDKFAKWMDNIPFLNGGLFECLDKRTKDKSTYIDGFSQQVKNESLVTVPDYLFFSDAPRNIDLNSTFHTKGKKYEVRGLIDILSRYKFTIEENTPVEEEVALDPELLGKVFENLLASYNEETETTARKLTGSFYTPREIVNYMVDESLITYLCNSLLKEDDENKREELNARLHHLFSYTAEEPQFTDAEKKELIDAIDTCKILDPACGSGAFPMGILHKLVFILGKLDPNNKRWKQKQQDKAKRDKALAEKMEDEKNRDAAIKEIDKRIEDIEKAFNQNNHELDFARKLYLIENCIYGVDKQPVAIQISKLRFFIALIVDQKTENDSEPNRGIRPLPNLETKFVAADTLVSIEKPDGLLVNLLLDKEIKEKEEEIHRVREKHFRARTPDTKEKYRALDSQLRDELALLLEQDGFPKDATKKLAGWNPYDQNKYADFFDPMWMFEIEDGFDILIGNPPYVLLQDKVRDNTALAYFKRVYKVAVYKVDLYHLFIERGLKLLKTGGNLTYINPANFLTNNYTIALRNMLLKETQFLQVVNLTENVFTASVNTCIIHNRKSTVNETNLKYYQANIIDDQLSLELLNSQKQQEYITDQSIIVPPGTAKEVNLLAIIDKKSKHLKEFAKVNFGMQLRDRKEHTSDVLQNPKKSELTKYHRKCYTGKDIHRFTVAYNDRYCYFNEVAKRGGCWDESIHTLKNKILIRQIGAYPIAGMDKLGYAVLNSAFMISSKGINSNFLLSQINSKLTQFYWLNKFADKRKDFPKIKGGYLELLPIIKSNSENIYSTLIDFTISSLKEEETENKFAANLFENVINGCVYELYFGEEMKKAGVDILALVEKDLETVKKLSPEKAIAKLYEKWQEPKNEVRNRLLLMATRCPDTIGVIEASVI
ncbi:MAG: Eco57I restriction-modification methylase domain-containing protein [Bacteroidetes bacterium]|nr:Eco57I restriction-modification methylase domain-containing protein [Bacteroidota bacterium]